AFLLWSFRPPLPRRAVACAMFAIARICSKWLRCQLSPWYARWVRMQTEELGAWLNLVQTHEAVAAGLEDTLKRANGLSLAEHEVLARLAETPDGRLRMLDLTGLVLLSKSGV